MGHVSHPYWRTIDAVDVVLTSGFACVVAGVDLRYDHGLALIIFGVGLLIISALAMWRRT